MKSFSKNGSNDDFVFSGPLLIYGCQLRENGTLSGLYHFFSQWRVWSLYGHGQPSIMALTVYLPQDLDIKNILDRFVLWNHNT